jgi:virginiamycin B lyase
MPTRIIVSFASVLFLSCAATAGAQDLFPDGPGRDILATKCRTCHMPDRVTKVPGRPAATWQTLVNTMINRGAPVTEDEVPILVEYLAKNWPVDKAVAAINYAPVAPMASHVRAEFTEWDVPTPASRPTDPLAASDGSIWYTGEAANVLGRLDPKTGEIKEFPLKTAQSGPQGLAEDRNGNIWYAADLKGQLGKLDPKTGNVTEYALSNAGGRDPRTPVVDQKGNVWFTVQDGNMIGRLTASGDFTLRPSPTPKSLPAGMAVNSKGVPFYAEFGANKIASVDPSSMAIREFVLPDSAARPRRLAIDAKDQIWFTDYARGYLGRLDPATGTVKEWASPGGPKAMPYAITVIGGDVWFSESGATPSTLVRFEPATERFQTWNIPSGGGAVQTMSVTKDGNLALAESDANRIALVTLSR